ncbi:MAG: citrate:proton symporter [Lachnospiraceae bacterium]|nr:citrate:proton symporter [Lachnospiraceae bacterium]
MDVWLSIVGFLVVFAIIFSIMSKKLTTMIALAVIPLIGAILVGQFQNIPAMVAAGISKVAVNGVMFFFAILFFGTMMTAGAFDPIVKAIVKACGGNPLAICIGTYILSTVGHLDGSATTTVLLVCGTMVPIYKKMGMRLRNLAAILGMAAGLMNMSPWGGPTLRAATVMEADLTAFFQPMFVPIVITWAIGLIPTVLLGLNEKKRLAAQNVNVSAAEIAAAAERTPEEIEMLRPKMTVINILLIIAVVALMISGILSPAAAFLIGTAAAWIVNYRSAADQKKIMIQHGPNAVFVVSALYGAGVLMGVLSQSGMAAAMANTLVSIIPASMTKFVPILVGIFATPLSMIFDADTFYYGILPVLTQSASALGISGAGICYAALVGQLTLGWSITPLTPATLLMCGMCDLDLGEHQKYSLRFVWPLSIVLLIILAIFGLII